MSAIPIIVIQSLLLALAAIGTIRGLVAEPGDKDAALRDIAIAADAVWDDELETPAFHWRNDDANRFSAA